MKSDRGLEEFGNSPAKDLDLRDQLENGIDQFRDLPSPHALKQCRDAGIAMTVNDVAALTVGLRMFQAYPFLFANPQTESKERRLRELSLELSALLREEGDWRAYWGDIDNLKRSPETAVDVKELRKRLEDLSLTANEKEEWLKSAKDVVIYPGNRANRVRYYYWLLLCGFWKYHLGREIGASTSPDRQDAYGPLITFLQAMSAGGMGEKQISGNNVRRWIRDHGHKVDFHLIKDLFE